MNKWPFSNYFFVSSLGWCRISLMLILLLPSLVNADVTCPPAAAYEPCDCSEASSKPGTVILTCDNLMNDSKVSDILDAFLTTPGVSPLGDLNLSNNQLTRVPSQIKLFDKLEWVDLLINSITSIESGAFNFPNAANPIRYLHLDDNQLTTIASGTFSFPDAANPIWGLYLDENRLTSIAPGAFKGEGYGKGTSIRLFNNTLRRFESTVFQSVLEKMAREDDGYAYGSIVIQNNPIDCSDCHLAWLIRDKRNFLEVVSGGTCSNGTRFKDLDPNGYADCPSFVCPLGYDGSYADLSNCTSFYTCVENTAIFNVCPNDQVFNPDTGRCDVSTNVPRCQVSSAAGNQIRLHDDTFLFVLLLTFVFVSLKWDCKLYR